MKKTALTIAGSDCSGGAGVQADIKTMEANGVYAMSVISVLTAQNTLGVQKLFPVSAECITAQIDSVFADIFPDAVKIGMPGTTELIQIIAERLRHYQAKHIVVDPVMLSSSGSTLVDESGRDDEKRTVSISRGIDSEHTGGRSADRKEDPDERRNGAGGRAVEPGVWNRYCTKRRSCQN